MRITAKEDYAVRAAIELAVVAPATVKRDHIARAQQIPAAFLENISQNAVNSFKEAGFQVDFNTKAWSEDELIEKIGSYHAIGIRSKTKITSKVLKAATKVRWIYYIGCFFYSSTFSF